MNKTLLRFTWVTVKAAEYVLPFFWKIGVALFYLLLGITFVFLLMIIL